MLLVYIYMDYNNEHHFKDYVLSRNLEESTIKEYSHWLNQYCLFLNKNSSELFEEVESTKKINKSFEKP